MGAPSARAVVLVPFPFSGLSRSKLRPAVVLAEVGRGDYVLCQVTSNRYSDPRAVAISVADFDAGSLQRASYARPGKLFTASENLMVRQVGTLKGQSFERIIGAVVALLQSGTR